MQTWKVIILAVGVALSTLILVTLFISGYLRLKSRKFPRRPIIQGQDVGVAGAVAYNRAFSSATGYDLAAIEGIQMAAKWRNMYPVKPFDWSDYPMLIADAVNRGWAAFAFTYSCSSQCPVSSGNAFVLCTKCCLGEAFQPEIAWEIGPGADFMQLIRLNPRLLQANVVHNDAEATDRSILVQALRSGLPLPGPLSELARFPQQGYFEITIVAVGSKDKKVTSSDGFAPAADGDNVKLILKPSPSEKYPLASAGANGNGNGHHYEPSKNRSSTKRIVQARIQASGFDRKRFVNENGSAHLTEAGDEQSQILAVGLSAGVAPPFRLPGMEPGSIGLHSNGHTFLDGTLAWTGMLQVDDGDRKLLPWRKKKAGWATVTNTTIGCGYSPKSRQVFFTLNGELVAELDCTRRISNNNNNNRDFSYPLHAVVASNYDVTLLINFGQCSFEFMAANAHRVADPSSNFRNAAAAMRSHSIHEESSDLFSIRRLDSQWWSGRRTSSLSQPEADADLFEISLDSRG